MYPKNRLSVKADFSCVPFAGTAASRLRFFRQGVEQRRKNLIITLIRNGSFAEIFTKKFKI